MKRIALSIVIIALTLPACSTFPTPSEQTETPPPLPQTEPPPMKPEPVIDDTFVPFLEGLKWATLMVYALSLNDNEVVASPHLDNSAAQGCLAQINSCNSCIQVRLPCLLRPARLRAQLSCCQPAKRFRQAVSACSHL